MKEKDQVKAKLTDIDITQEIKEYRNSIISIVKDNIVPLNYGNIDSSNSYQEFNYIMRELQSVRIQYGESNSDFNLTDIFFVQGYKPEFLIQYLTDVKESHFLTLPNDVLLTYNNGIYIDLEIETAKEVMNLLSDRVKESYVSETIKLLKRSSAKKDIKNHITHINFLNGMYNIETKELEPHHPKFQSVIQIPVEYNPNAECPNIDAFYKEKLNEDDIELLMEMFGYCLLQYVPIPAFFVLKGDTHTGKSTTLKLLTALLGKNNTSENSIHDIEDSNHRFSRYELFNKLANIDDDMGFKTLQGDGYIKKISAGNPITIEAKYSKPFSTNLYSTLIGATNDDLRSLDNTDAWLHRMQIIPFDNSHKDNPVWNILENMTTPQELSGLLNKVLDALHNLLDRGRFTSTEYTQQCKADYTIKNDPAKDFLHSNYDTGQTIEWQGEKVLTRIPVGVIYEEYEDWLPNSAMRISRSAFYKILRDFSGYKIKNAKSYKENDYGERKVFKACFGLKKKEYNITDNGHSDNIRIEEDNYEDDIQF